MRQTAAWATYYVINDESYLAVAGVTLGLSYNTIPARPAAGVGIWISCR